MLEYVAHSASPSTNPTAINLFITATTVRWTEGFATMAPGLVPVYRLRYIAPMEYIVRQTEGFAQWRASLCDLKVATAIRRRMERAQAGNLGDVKPVREGISEMRVDVGVGYRLYFTIRNRRVLFLLAGGDKKSQDRDIRAAIALAKEI